MSGLPADPFPGSVALWGRGSRAEQSPGGETVKQGLWGRGDALCPKKSVNIREVTATAGQVLSPELYRISTFNLTLASWVLGVA